MVAIQKDAQSTTAEGRTLEQLPWGVSCHEVTTHVDDRGTLVELFNPSWGWHDAPLVYCYCFTLRPGVIKGWAMHKRHEDHISSSAANLNWSFTTIVMVHRLAAWFPSSTCPSSADG